jgi:hypothetical protein
MIFTQLTAMDWLLVLDLKEGLAECAAVCVKSEVMLLYVQVVINEIGALSLPLYQNVTTKCPWI